MSTKGFASEMVCVMNTENKNGVEIMILVSVTCKMIAKGHSVQKV